MLKFMKTRHTVSWLMKKHGIHFRLPVTLQLSGSVQGLIEKEMTFVDFILIYSKYEAFSHCSYINVTVTIKCILKLLRHYIFRIRAKHGQSDFTRQKVRKILGTCYLIDNEQGLEGDRLWLKAEDIIRCELKNFLSMPKHLYTEVVTVRRKKPK